MNIRVGAPGEHECDAVARFMAARGFPSPLLAHHFRSTCVVARADADLVGVAAGYRVPEDVQVFFLSKLVVHEAYRRRGIASLLVDYLVSSPPLWNVDHVEALVPLDNTCWRATLQGLSRRMECPLVERRLPEPHLAGAAVCRVGPLRDLVAG